MRPIRPLIEIEDGLAAKHEKRKKARQRTRGPYRKAHMR